MQSFCGNLRIVRSDFFLLDSDKTPLGTIKVKGIYFDGIFFALEDNIFTTKSAIISYLNTTFVPTNSLQGEFYGYGAGIYYKNVDNFTTAEIMIEYGLKTLIFKIGTPLEDTNDENGYDATFANGTTFSSPLLHGMREVSVRIGNNTSEPVNSYGHKYESIDPSNSLNGKMTFSQTIENAILYVTLTQKPE